jgi:hypothetical protein
MSMTIRRWVILMMVTITSMGTRNTPMNIAMMMAIMTMSISVAINREATLLEMVLHGHFSPQLQT